MKPAAKMRAWRAANPKKARRAGARQRARIAAAIRVARNYPAELEHAYHEELAKRGLK